MPLETVPDGRYEVRAEAMRYQFDLLHDEVIMLEKLSPLQATGGGGSCRTRRAGCWLMLRIVCSRVGGVSDVLGNSSFGGEAERSFPAACKSDS